MRLNQFECFTSKFSIKNNIENESIFLYFSEIFTIQGDNVIMKFFQKLDGMRSQRRDDQMNQRKNWIEESTPQIKVLEDNL